MLSESRCSPCYDIGCSKYHTWILANCSVSLVTLCPLMAESFNKQMLSFYEETGGRAKSMLFTYCNEVESLGNFMSSRLAFRICGK